MDSLPETHRPVYAYVLRTSTYGILFLAILFWGSSFVATKVVLRSFRPLDFIFLRFAGGTILFVPIVLCRKRPAIDARTHLVLALMAFFEPGLYFIFETYGLQYTSASNASIIIAAAPVVVALMARAVLSETLSARAWTGVVLSMLGVLVLSGVGRWLRGGGGAAGVLPGEASGHAAGWLHGRGEVFGNALVFLAVISASGYMMVARRLSARLSAFDITFFQILYGTVLYLPLFLIRYPSIEWRAVELDSLGALLFLVLFSTVAAFLAYNHAISKIGASRAAVFLNGIPVVTVIVARVVLREEVGMIHLLGGIMVIAGVILSSLGRKVREVPSSYPIIPD
jgi:drug/metabolite transporter (DMT)-like permease